MNRTISLFFRILKSIIGKHYYPLLLNLMHYKKKTFRGHSLESNIKYLDEIIYDLNINSLLDFGCGKPIFYNPSPYKKELEIYLYDPYYYKFRTAQSKKYDLVIATDVMEHIEKNNVNNVIQKITSYAKKAIYLSICTRPAKKKLPDGRNAHINIMNNLQWIKIIKKHKKKDFKIFIRFDENTKLNII